MRRISFVLETKPSGLVIKKPIQVTDAVGRANWDVQQCGKELFDLLQQNRFWTSRRRPKLKNLAMTLYLELSGLKVHRHTLGRDLKAAQKWQAQNPTGYLKLLPRGVLVGKKPAEAEVNYIPLRRTRWLVHKRP